METKLYVLTKNGELHPVEDLQVKFESESGGLDISPKFSNQKTDLDEHFDVNGISKFLDMKPSGIYGLVHKRKIPHVKKGKRLYFFKNEIMEWLRNGNIDTECDIQNKADEYLRKNKI